MTDRQTGTVKFYHSDKAWGFLRRDDGTEIFVHKRNIQGNVDLIAGQKVTFTTEATKKGNGMAAVDVRAE